ncbi:MAG: hypothetical protein EOP42_16300 [Sphingobacteriaceae bacterium]|nr:MAG: hypothetical protein EOP42_16300 [Sphingobacteriaceae bacterium]
MKSTENMHNVIFYSFKIENISFQSDGNLTTSTPFIKDEVVDDLKRKLAKTGYKMAADNSHKIIKIDNELFIEGIAYEGQSPTETIIKGYFNTIK